MPFYVSQFVNVLLNQAQIGYFPKDNATTDIFFYKLIELSDIYLL